MARQESEREDLLREATALIERIEFCIDGHAEPIVFGFRRGESASLYISSEPVFQFNTRRELRRVFWQGRMLKAEQRRLVALPRHRTTTSVELARQPLAEAELARVLTDCRSWLYRIEHAITANLIQVTGQVSADGLLIRRVESWLQAMPAELAIAERPNVE